MVEKFLIDANAFITPYRNYYAFDLIPAYWDEIARHAALGRIIVLDLVKAEIDKGGDALSKWLKEQTNFHICKHATAKIVGKWQEILQYIKDSDFYSENALHSWSDEKTADPWLIAAAAVNHYTIITVETRSGGLSTKSQSNSPKIPDIADVFKVPTGNVFYMMRQLEIMI